MPARENTTDLFRSLQDTICSALEKEDGKSRFTEDNWRREDGGGGRSRILQNGAVIEKGGVNFSAVYGAIPEFLKKESDDIIPDNSQFFATGISIVLHPVSPMVPIIHMNLRYFETHPKIKNQKSKMLNWFGGGIDLTPHYIDADDAHFFHRSLKEVCDKFDKDYYPEFKKWADDYFFIPHRNEARGIGGVFFDKLKADEHHSLEQRFDFVKAVGNAFIPIYSHLIRKNGSKPYSEKQKQWQLLRRGRYVEFNLVYDKGTRFGLETNGRTESILMSLPGTASWWYDYIPEKGGEEEKTQELLKKGILWDF